MYGATSPKIPTDSEHGVGNGFGGETDLDALLGDMEGGDIKPAPSSPTPTTPTVFCGVLSVAAYQKYFDVDDSEVKLRLIKALTPCKTDETLFEKVEGRPDAYGPIWVSTTLLFTLSLAATFSSWKHFVAKQSTADAIAASWTYDFQVVVFGAFVVYGFLVLAPVTAWGVLKYFSIPLVLVELFCIYGYSLVVYIPISLISCFFQSSFVEFLLVLIACALSYWTIYNSIGNIITTQAGANALKLKGFLGGIHACFSLVLFFAFFHF